MKSLPIRGSAPALCAFAALVLTLTGPQAPAQAAKGGKSAKAPAAKSGTGAKPAARPAAPSQFDQHLAANLKFFRVLSHYAETLSGAQDATTAHEAVTKLEEITKEAITAGEELVKLGKPAPDLEAKLAANADLTMTAQTVAEQTRAAVKALAENAEIKTILAPAVENFQAALNRVQQAADEPAGLSGNEAAPPAPAPAEAKESPPPASETTAVPPPPQ